MLATAWIHGDDDRNAPFQQTTDLVEKLRAQKKSRSRS
jgi:dipeptidyl aminopeptidase/acylaminoacyl peptidase